MNILRNLPFLEDKPVSTLLPLQGDNPLHLNNEGSRLGSAEDEPQFGAFGDVLMAQLNRTNDQQMESELLQQQMLVSPDSVDIQDVTIAMARANMSLSLTKAVVDRAVQAYQEISNLR